MHPLTLAQHLLGVKEIMLKYMPRLVPQMNLVFRECSSYYSVCQKVSNHCGYKHEVIQLFSNCTLFGIIGSFDAWEYNPHNSEYTEVIRTASQPCCNI